MLLIKVGRLALLPAIKPQFENNEKYLMLQVDSNRRMNQENMVYIHNEALLSYKEE